MDQISDAIRSQIHAALADHRALLFLGAGASRNCVNGRGTSPPIGTELAAILASAAAIPFNDEPLPLVMDAVQTKLTTPAINQILHDHYSHCKPDSALNLLLQFRWRRLYSFNIDDSINACTQTANQQTRFYYNALCDKIGPVTNSKSLQVVQLNGTIIRPEHSFIFSNNDYSRAQNAIFGSEAKHLHWYSEAAQDYVTFLPIAIGCTLDEPILWTLVDSALPTHSSRGTAYLITPTQPTPIELAAYRSRGINHIHGTLQEFTEWLQSTATESSHVPTVDAIAVQNVDGAGLSRLSRQEELELFSITPLDPTAIRAKAGGLLDNLRRAIGRDFYLGDAPTWVTASSNIPVPLSVLPNLLAKIEEMQDDIAMLVVKGEAGCGKSTAAMMALLQYAEKTPGIFLAELTPDVRSVRNVYSALSKLFPSVSRFVLFVNDLFLFSTTLASDLQHIPRDKVKIVATARSSEWQGNFARHFSRHTSTFDMSRFTPADAPTLITQLLHYVPSPTLKKSTPSERLDRLNRSQHQLLIALREATHSARFDDIISEEYTRLPSEDARLLLLICGVATVARVGLSETMTKSIYRKLHSTIEFDEAITMLDGIVFSRRGRFIGRHDTYVRHIIETEVDASETLNVVEAILEEFTKYEVPIVRRANREDAQLFKYLLNHEFLHKLSKQASDTDTALAVYRRFESDFQLDGHFWLQFGQFLDLSGDLISAHEKLRRSVEAYPDNLFAQHALARIKLRIAAKRTSYDAEARKLIDEAVDVLVGQDNREPLDIDEYPIVTLAKFHIAALTKLGQDQECQRVARKYLERLVELERTSSDSRVFRARRELTRLIYGRGDPSGRFDRPPSRSRRGSRR